MKQVVVDRFLRENESIPIVDVRSPKEFEEGHICGAINIPLLGNSEREIIGTLYKQEGKESAVVKGYELVNPQKEALLDRAHRVHRREGLRIYCWRGGMRSNKMAELFESTDIACEVLIGGYKAFRKELHLAFQDLPRLVVLDGKTGSGKTAVLHALGRLGEQVLDLEGYARHRGSAFGSVGLGPQPTTAQFQNNLFRVLRQFDGKARIWVECESHNIGKVYLPESLWEAMLVAPAIEMLIEKEIRIGRLVQEYGQFPVEELQRATLRIQKRLGGKRTEEVIEKLERGALGEVASVLLTYYDKSYGNSLKRFSPKVKFPWEGHSLNDEENARALIQFANENGL
ncbi:MAG: tRNA 2-selenouridine(34) synthase MnmH [Bacteroidota bacterium]